jgi:hypothetical protein
MFGLRRLVSTLLILELFLQPILVLPTHASMPALKQEGDLEYYEVKKPSDARALDLPDEALFVTDLDLSLVQCSPFGSQKYQAAAYPMDDQYVSWIREPGRRWMALTARNGRFAAPTRDQLITIGVQFNAFTNLFGNNKILSTSDDCFFQDNVFYAPETQNAELKKGSCLHQLLLEVSEGLKAYGASHRNPEHIVVLDDSLDELRGIYQANPDKKLTLIHINNNATLRGYPEPNPSFPQTIFDLQYRETFNGGTGGAHLLVNQRGQRFVFKPMRQTHELFGELAYRALEQFNPDLAVYGHIPYELRRIVSLNDGPFRLAEYVDALANQDFAEIIRQSQLRLVIDSFFLNWDCITLADNNGVKYFKNQILGADNLLHPIDMGSCGTYIHTGRFKEDIYSLTTTIELMREKLSSMATSEGDIYVTEQHVFDQMSFLLARLPRIFQAFELVKEIGVLYTDELEQFLGDRSRMLTHRVDQTSPHLIWQGPCLSSMDHSGAGIFLVHKDSVVLGIRKNGQQLGNLGGFIEQEHRYPHVTAALEIHEETAGGIMVDPVRLLECPRVNSYHYRGIYNKSWTDLFRYTMYFYPLEQLDLGALNRHLNQSTREEEREITELVLISMATLYELGKQRAKHVTIDRRAYELFKPFAQSLQLLAERSSSFDRFLDFLSPISIDFFGQESHITCYGRDPYISPPDSIPRFPDKTAELGLHLAGSLRRLPTLGQRPAEALRRPLPRTASHSALQSYVATPDAITTRLRLAMAQEGFPLKVEDSFLTRVADIMGKEEEHPSDHYLYHGTTGKIGFQWLALTAYNQLLGSSTLRVRAVEEKGITIESAHQFVTQMLASGVIEEHYSPGHSDNWMAFSISLLNCLSEASSSPLNFFYTGTSRTSLGDGMPILAEMYRKLDLADSAQAMLLAGYERIYRKFFSQQAGRGCLLQVWMDDQAIDQNLYLAGVNAIPATTQDGAVPAVSAYLTKFRSGEPVNTLKCRFEGTEYPYGPTSLRSQLLVTPASLQHAQHRFHFWPPMDMAPAMIEINNLIKTHLFALIPRLITSPAIYKQLPPVAAEVQQQFKIQRKKANLSMLARETAFALEAGLMPKVFDLLSGNPALLRIKFFSEDFGHNMTIEEYASALDQETNSAKYTQRIAPYLDYLYDLLPEERAPLEELAEHYIPQLLPYQRAVIIHHLLQLDPTNRRTFMTYACEVIKHTQNHDQINEIAHQIGLMLDMGFPEPIENVQRAVRYYDNLQTAIDEKILEVACALGEKPRISPKALSFLTQLATSSCNPGQKLHPMDILKSLREELPTTEAFVKTAQHLDDQGFGLPLKGLIIARKICHNPSYADTAISCVHRLTQLYKSVFLDMMTLNDVVDMNRMRVSSIHFRILLVIQKISERIIIDPENDGPYLTGFLVFLFRFLLSKQNPDPERDLTLMVKFLSDEIRETKIPVRIIHGMSYVHQLHYQMDRLVEFAKGLIDNLLVPDWTSPRLEEIFSILRLMEVETWPDFKQLVQHPQKLEGIYCYFLCRHHEIVGYRITNPDILLPFITAYENDNPLAIAKHIGAAIRDFQLTEQDFDALARFRWKTGGNINSAQAYLDLHHTKRQEFRKGKIWAKGDYKFLYIMQQLFGLQQMYGGRCSYTQTDMERILTKIKEGHVTKAQLSSALTYCLTVHPDGNLLAHFDNALAKASYPEDRTVE